MNNARTAQVLVLLLPAIAIGLLTPTLVPAAASVNAHSVNINSSSLAFGTGNSTLSYGYNGTLIIQSPGSNGTTYTSCSADISLLPTSTNETIYFTITIVPGSCHTVNG